MTTKQRVEVDEDGETHYKMCKKIAQLTKVIFHLHTKTEESDYSLRDLANSYKLQIDEVKFIPKTYFNFSGCKGC